jgi:Lrp/AsnC family transcriptional regulator
MKSLYLGKISLYLEIMEIINPIDRRILVQLQRNADLALDEIAERVALSRNAVWRRIKALEASGVIAKRVAILDAAKLNLGLSVFILIRTAQHDPKWLETFSKMTADLPEIQAAYRMSGELDYLVRARVADVADYDRLYQRIIRRVDLSDVSASFVMEDIKETTELAL